MGSTKAQIDDLIDDKILTGGRRTKALDARTVFKELNISTVNIIDNADLLVNSITKTYAELAALKSGSDLIPQARYFISDKDIYLTAITNNTLKLEGVYIARVPDYVNATTFFEGVWNSSLSGLVANQSLVAWNGFNYKNKTGLVGTAPDGDTANWQFLATTDSSYQIEMDYIHYDFDNDTIILRIDKRGNCVETTFLLNTFFGYSPIDKFQWGRNDNACNTAKCAVFNNLNALNGQLFTTTTYQSIVTITDSASIDLSEIIDGCIVDLSNNANGTGMILEKGVQLTATDDAQCILLDASDNTEFILSGTANISGMKANNFCFITASDDANGSQSEIYLSNVDISGNSEMQGCKIYDNSTIQITDGVKINGTECRASEIIADGSYNGITMLLSSNSSIEAHGGSSDGAILKQGSVLTMNDTPNCNNIQIYSGATVTAGDTADLSSSIILNLSIVNGSDTISATGSHIDASNVDIIGTVSVPLLCVMGNSTVDLSGAFSGTSVEINTSSELTATGGSANFLNVMCHSIFAMNSTSSAAHATLTNECDITLNSSASVANSTFNKCTGTLAGSAQCIDNDCHFSDVNMSGTTSFQLNYIFNSNIDIISSAIFNSGFVIGESIIDLRGTTNFDHCFIYGQSTLECVGGVTGSNCTLINSSTLESIGGGTSGSVSGTYLSDSTLTKSGGDRQVQNGTFIGATILANGGTGTSNNMTVEYSELTITGNGFSDRCRIYGNSDVGMTGGDIRDCEIKNNCIIDVADTASLARTTIVNSNGTISGTTSAEDVTIYYTSFGMTGGTCDNSIFEHSDISLSDTATIRVNAFNSTINSSGTSAIDAVDINTSDVTTADSSIINEGSISLAFINNSGTSTMNASQVNGGSVTLSGSAVYDNTQTNSDCVVNISGSGNFAGAKVYSSNITSSNAVTGQGCVLESGSVLTVNGNGAGTTLVSKIKLFNSSVSSTGLVLATEAIFENTTITLVDTDDITGSRFENLISPTVKFYKGTHRGAEAGNYLKGSIDLFAITVDANPQEAFLDSDLVGGVGTYTFKVPANTLHNVVIYATAFSLLGNAASYEIRPLIKNLGGTTSLEGTATPVTINAAAALAAATIAVTANNTGDYLQIVPTGVLGETIGWAFRCEYIHAHG